MVGISIDAPPSNAKFAREIGVTFPLLSDMKREVLAKYGILDEQSGLAKRTTFFLDKQGTIRQIVQGKEAIDPSGTVAMCTLHGK